MNQIFVIDGKVSFIKYSTEGFQALSFAIGEKNEDASLKSGDVISMTSNLNLEMGITYHLKVEKTEHFKYGTTYKVLNIEQAKLNDKENIIRYLASNVPGIGKVAAEKIYDHFGDTLIEKIAHEPELLDEIDLSDVQRLKLIDFFHNQIDLITQKIINWCFQAKIDPMYNFKNMSFQKLARESDAFKFANFTQNPFEALPVLINKNIEASLSNELRIETFLKTYYPFNYEFYLKMYRVHNEPNVVEETFYKLLCHMYKKIDSNTYLTFDEINEFLQKELMEEEIQAVWKKIYASPYFWFSDEVITFSKIYEKEKYIFETLENIVSQESYIVANNKEHFNLDSVLANEISKSEIKLNEQQQQIVKSAFINPLTLVNGRPGTGKTTTIKQVVNLIELADSDDTESTNWPILLAPTGKAARRLEEVTNIRAYTMHRFFAEVILLEDKKTLKNKLVIIDEASMISYDALIFTLSWISKYNCKLMLVGDTFQLPPIGLGSLFQDLVKYSNYPKIELSKILRQAEHSKINVVLEGIRNENFDFSMIENADDIFFTQISDNQALEFILKRFKNKVYSFSNSIILSPRKNGSFLSATRNINDYFQNNYNESIEYMYRGEKTKFKPYDEVMYVENKYQRSIQNIRIDESPETYHQYSFFNGDEGTVLPSDLGAIGKLLTVKNKLDGLENTFELNKDRIYNYLELGYAKTIHKAQGSEYDNVFLLIYPEQGFGLLEPRLIYTAISRAKSKIFICGDKATFLKALSHARMSEKQNLISYFYGLEKGE